MYLFGADSRAVRRGFGGPFGGCTEPFFPPFGFGDCDTTTSESEPKTTTETQQAPPPSTHTQTEVQTQTTVIVTPTVVTSVVVVTSGNTFTGTTTFTSGSTITSIITPLPTPGPPSSKPSSSSFHTSRTGGSSSSSTPSDTVQRTATLNHTIIETETAIASSPSSPLPPTGSTKTTATLSTSSETVVLAQPPQPQSHGLNAGEIAAICIACISVLALCIMIWRAWRRKRVEQGGITAVGEDLPSSGNEGEPSQRAVPEPGHARAAMTSPLSEPNTPGPSGGILEHLDEKRDTMSRYSDGGETAMSPGSSSSAYSSSPLLNPPANSPTPPNEVGPTRSQIPRLRSWDDPPPTPDFRPVSLRTSGSGAYRRSHGGDGLLSATTENHETWRDTAYTGYSVPEEQRSDAELGQPPEYSRY